MEADLFLRALAIGFAIAAPVGPIGLLVIRRTLAAGPVAGFAAGMGAATADGVYGAVAAFGLGAAALALAGDAWWLKLGGACLLVYLGARTLATPPPAEITAPSARALAGDYLTTVILTLANPATILSFAAVFAGIGLGEAAAGGGWRAPVMVVAGVFLGSAAWWLILCAAVARLRHRLGPGALVWVNRAAGAVLIGFGFAAGLS